MQDSFDRWSSKVLAVLGIVGGAIASATGIAVIAGVSAGAVVFHGAALCVTAFVCLFLLVKGKAALRKRLHLARETFEKLGIRATPSGKIKCPVGVRDAPEIADLIRSMGLETPDDKIGDNLGA